MFPSPSRPPPPPFLSKSHTEERDQLDKNLNQYKCETQCKKKQNFFGITEHAADIVPSNYGSI